MIKGVHWIDASIIAAYFLITLYIGVVRGGRKTKTLGDFFVAGGKWGPLVSFIFIFTSAVAGNEAVVVSGQAYQGGISGVWYWWSFLFATPVYFLYAKYFRRARVYNISEFLEMRYNKPVSALYSLVGGIMGILFIGMFLLAVAKIIHGFTQFSTQECVWIITLVVVAYVYSGGMMSTLLTDLFQGALVIVFLCFIMLPFLWNKAGGWEALQVYGQAHPDLWNLIEPNTMGLSTVVALSISAVIGGIATPWMFSWISVSKNELSATQCGWGHLWKRIVTLLFALYGILFAIYKPGLSDPEASWGIVMNEILPTGALGLMIISFFAAAMSSAGSFATSSSSVLSNYFYRNILIKNRSNRHYLRAGRICAVLAIIFAAVSTSHIVSIKDYVKLSMNLMSFVGIPLHFGMVWKKSNNAGMWASLIAGIMSYIIVLTYYMCRFDLSFTGAIDPSFEASVYISSAAAIVGMFLGSYLGRPTEELKARRFYVIMNTAVGKESRLVNAGIKLPGLIDAGLMEDGPENLKVEELNRLYEEDSCDKFLGKDSAIELKREHEMPWYYPGAAKILIACILLIITTWLLTKLLFVW